MSSDNTRSNSQDPHDSTKDQANLSATHYFYFGLIAGLIVLAVGLVAFQFLNVPSSYSLLILVTGIGLILGAFGSTATAKFKGVTVTGTAVIVILLLTTVADISDSQATFFEITGPDIEKSVVSVVAGQEYLGANRNRRYRFVVPGGEINHTSFDVFISIPDEEPSDFHFRSINKRFIAAHLGSSVIPEWGFDKERGVLVEAVTGFVMQRIEVQLADESYEGDFGGKKKSWSIISSAFAQDREIRSIPEIITNLNSNAPRVRRTAQMELVELGPSAVGQMLAALTEKDASYRLRSGVIVGLAEILREDKRRASEIRKLFSNEDIVMLTSLLDEADRTIRVPAGEFLYDLEDPRVIPLALSLAESSTRDESVYLAIFVVSKIIGEMPESQVVASRLMRLEERVDPKTADLIATITKSGTVTDLAGKYTGQWESTKRLSLYGTIVGDLKVDENGSAKYGFVLTGSKMVKERNLTGVITQMEDGVWVTKLTGPGTVLHVKFDKGVVSGEYITTWGPFGGWFNLFKDVGRFELTRKY